MAKNHEYPDTGWGREAEEEDLDQAAGPQIEQYEPMVYRTTYERARNMQAEGQSSEAITAALDTPPISPAPMADGRLAWGMKIRWRVEQHMVYVRKQAIGEALAGTPPRHS